MNVIRKKRCGMTLVEMMIAMFILGIALLGFYKAAVLSVRTTNTAFDRTYAIYLAEQTLNYLKNSVSPTVHSPVPTNTVRANDIDYTVTWDVSDEITFAYDSMDEAGTPLINGDPSNPSYFARGHNVSVKVSWNGMEESVVQFIPVHQTPSTP